MGLPAGGSALLPIPHVMRQRQCGAAATVEDCLGGPPRIAPLAARWSRRRKGVRLNDHAGKRFVPRRDVESELALRGDDFGVRPRLAATGSSQISQVNGQPTSRP